MKILEEGRSGEINQRADFFSGITGLSVRNLSIFPELKNFDTHRKIPHEIPFTYSMSLGYPGADEYNLQVEIRFTDKHGPGEWLPSFEWQIDFNGEQIFRKSYTQIRSFFAHHLQDKQGLKTYVEDEVSHILGGPSTVIDFMDFEYHTLEALREEDYFANIYLVLMTHMKARGLAMPPILGKHQELQSFMERGNIREVSKLLDAIFVFDAGAFDIRCQAHMHAEAKKIRERTQWEYEKRDSSRPIEEVYPDLHYEIVEGGGTATWSAYNISCRE